MVKDIVYSFLEELANLCNYDLRPRDLGSWSDLFWYQFPVISNVAAGATAAPVQVIIQDDSDFEWIASSYHFNLANAAFLYNTQPIPNMSVVIIDSGSGKQLMNAPVPVDCIFGSPGKPYMLAQPRVLTRNSTYTATATNFDAAVATGQLYLTMIGRKLYNVR